MSGRVRRFAAGFWLAVVFVLLCGGRAWTAEVRVPLTIPYLTLSEALKAELYNGAVNRADIWQESDCEYLNAENPRFSHQADLLRLETDANLNVGTAIGDNCIDAISWTGIVQALAVPYVTADWKLKFRITDLNLYDRQHQKTVLVSRGFDLIKSYLVPRLEQFSFDLRTPITQLMQMVRAGVPDEYRAQVSQALASIVTVPPAIASERGLRITLRVPLPQGLKVPMIAPRAEALTPADVAAWEKALDNWDAFMVFAVKQLAGSTRDQDFREDLLDLLLDSRHRLLLALEQPEHGSGPDPVRIWFIDTWGRFDERVQRAAAKGLFGNRTLEFLSFISAGDALFAFDQAAPALGVRISAADLRALAHIMAPDLKTDPLAFSFDEDPELQRLFGIRPPVDTPDALPDRPEGDVAPAPSAAPSPPGSPPGATASMDFLSRLSGWITPPAIAAMQVVTIDSEIRALAQRLLRKVPERSNLDRYRADVARLLDLSASREVDDDYLETHYGTVTHRLVRSAAWQESCWRQFVVKGKRITYLESSTRDVGLMQVNKYVWRGFYSIPRLEWDIAYNAGAGAQILLGRLRDCARNLAGHGIASTPDDLVRSAYSAYNGGPASCSRWNHVDSPSRDSLVDVSFWLKYQALEQGDQLDILQCAAHWHQLPGH